MNDTFAEMLTLNEAFGIFIRPSFLLPYGLVLAESTTSVRLRQLGVPVVPSGLKSRSVHLIPWACAHVYNMSPLRGWYATVLSRSERRLSQPDASVRDAFAKDLFPPPRPLLRPTLPVRG